MKNWLRKFINFISHHNTLTVVTFLIFGGGCYYVYKCTDSNKIGTIASMATALAIIVAMIQLLASNRQHRENAKRAAAEKAIEIARYFQAQIIGSISYLTAVLSVIGSARYEDSEKLKNSPLRFTKEEFLSLFGDRTVDDYAVSEKRITYHVLEFAAKYSVHDLPKNQDSNQAQLCIRQERVDMLNTLEWIAMMLRTGVADEMFLYQSLHQLLLPYIRLEYPHIALLNSDDCASGQYFTNLMWLYNTWQSRKLKGQQIDEQNVKRRKKAEQSTFRRIMNRRNKNLNIPPHL